MNHLGLLEAPDLVNEDGATPREQSPGKPTTRCYTDGEKDQAVGWSARSLSWAPITGTAPHNGGVSPALDIPGDVPWALGGGLVFGFHHPYFEM